MDYLALCQALRREADVSGSGPTTVVGQTSMYEKLVGWVALAWTDIQISRPNWLFMNEEFSFPTVSGQRDYTPAGVGIADLNLWDTGSFLIYKTATGESDQNILPNLDYGKWRDRYRSQMNARANGRPSVFTLLPNNSVRFEARPDDIYTIDGEYKRTNQVFTDNADVPTGFPDHFHMMIVWRALMYYADDQSAPEALNKAVEAYNPLLYRLENEQLPKFNEDYKALA